MASSPRASRLVIKATPAIFIGLALLVAGLLYRETTASPVDASHGAVGLGVGAVIQADLPVAPDYAFEVVPDANAPTLDPAAAAALARDAAPPGFLGKNPVVRYLVVKSRQLNYGPTFVIFSGDAAPIRSFGANGTEAITPAVATYGWVFLTPSGEFIGASRAGFPADPPAFPAN